MKTDNSIVYDSQRRSQMRKAEWAARRERFNQQYGSQSVGAYQSHANPALFRDWVVDARTCQVVAHTDYMQPDFQIFRYGGSMVLRESDILAGGKSLAQDCSIPKRDENGFLIETVDLEEAA